MSTTVVAEPTELIIKRHFTAPIDLVFRAWTDEKLLVRWLFPEAFAFTGGEFDFRVGGLWKSGMRSPDGDVYVMHGEYLEIDPPRRLSFTHSWEKMNLPDHDPAVVTTVTIDLYPDDDGTEMVFVQTGFTRHEASISHGGGWNGAFNNLDQTLQEKS